jgi:hypothetical protein
MGKNLGWKDAGMSFFVEDFGKGSPSSKMEAKPNGWEEEMGSNFGERLLFPGHLF